MPKILLLDGDYIIADDFDVDVPEIIHKPKWFFFQPEAHRVKSPCYTVYARCIFLQSRGYTVGSLHAS